MPCFARLKREYFVIMGCGKESLFILEKCGLCHVKVLNNFCFLCNFLQFTHTVVETSISNLGSKDVDSNIAYLFKCL